MWQNAPYQPASVRLPKLGTLCPHTFPSPTMLEPLVLPGAGSDYNPPVKSLTISEHG